jgi:hypothetical protein
MLSRDSFFIELIVYQSENITNLSIHIISSVSSRNERESPGRFLNALSIASRRNTDVILS